MSYTTTTTPVPSLPATHLHSVVRGMATPFQDPALIGTAKSNTGKVVPGLKSNQPVFLWLSQDQPAQQYRDDHAKISTICYATLEAKKCPKDSIWFHLRHFGPRVTETVLVIAVFCPSILRDKVRKALSTNEIRRHTEKARLQLIYFPYSPEFKLWLAGPDSLAAPVEAPRPLCGQIVTYRDREATVSLILFIERARQKSFYALTVDHLFRPPQSTTDDDPGLLPLRTTTPSDLEVADELSWPETTPSWILDIEYEELNDDSDDHESLKIASASSVSSSPSTTSRLINHHRSHYQTSSLLNEAEGNPLPRLGPCLRARPGYHADWLTFADSPHIYICPSCFDATVGTTVDLRNHVRVAKPLSKPIACSFSSPWMRLALLLTHENKDHLLLQRIIRVAHAEAISEACPGEYPATCRWFTLVNRGRQISAFQVCECDVAKSKALVPSVEDLWEESESSGKRRYCALRMGIGQFATLMDELIRVDKVARIKGRRPSLDGLVNMVNAERAVNAAFVSENLDVAGWPSRGWQHPPDQVYLDARFYTIGVEDWHHSPSNEVYLDWALIDLGDESHPGLLNTILPPERSEPVLLIEPKTYADVTHSPVWIILASRGAVPGMSYPSEAYLGTRNNKNLALTFTVCLSTDNHVLRPGDSGSLVVRQQDYAVLGYVVACNPLGEAYVVPYQSVKQQIVNSAGVGENDVCFPSASDVTSLSSPDTRHHEEVASVSELNSRRRPISEGPSAPSSTTSPPQAWHPTQRSASGVQGLDGDVTGPFPKAIGQSNLVATSIQGKEHLAGADIGHRRRVRWAESGATGNRREQSDSSEPGDARDAPNDNEYAKRFTAEHGHSHTVDLLNQPSVDVSVRDVDHTTSLHDAARNYKGLAESLLSVGSDKSVRDDLPGTPLHLAAAEGHLDVVKTLLRYGADINIRDHREMTAHDLALQNKHLGLASTIASTQKPQTVETVQNPNGGSLIRTPGTSAADDLVRLPQHVPEIGESAQPLGISVSLQGTHAYGAGVHRGESSVPQSADNGYHSSDRGGHPKYSTELGGIRTDRSSRSRQNYRLGQQGVYQAAPLSYAQNQGGYGYPVLPQSQLPVLPSYASHDPPPPSSQPPSSLPQRQSNTWRKSRSRRDFSPELSPERRPNRFSRTSVDRDRDERIRDLERDNRKSKVAEEEKGRSSSMRSSFAKTIAKISAGAALLEGLENAI